mgnify:CR=1 FL=1|tara:strand:+ start:32955 stop:33461 length:507 start_codon:yes stop_codon:yes gene_type:complete
MTDKDEINFKDVINGETKIEYVDQLEVLRAKLNSGNFLKSRSSNKELISIVENLIDILPVEMRTARWLVREQDSFLSEAREESQNIINNAKRESEELISNSYVLQEAVIEANSLIKQAEKEAQAYRMNIEDEMDRMFTELQSKLEQLNLYIANEKSSLRKPREIIDPE